MFTRKNVGSMDFVKKIADINIKYKPDCKFIPSYIFKAFIKAKIQNTLKNKENFSSANVF